MEHRGACVLKLTGVRNLVIPCLLAVLLTGLVGCTFRDADVAALPTGGGIQSRHSAAGSSLSGRITVDGSSTVYPISQAVAEDFMKLHPRVAVSVDVGGTGGGFKRFMADSLDICDASRPITADEAAACRRNRVRYLDLKIGIDGLSVVVNKENTWCRSLTVGQLKRLWESRSTITRWNQLDPRYPNEEIVLYGPDTDSGSFDSFTEVICGRRGNCRSDYTPSSNDNVLIQGVEGDPGALGYFGFAYYALHKDALRAISVAADDGSAAIAPSDETILSGKYSPLSRPLFLYVNRDALVRPEVAAFLRFYLDQGPSIVSEVHSIPLPAAENARSIARLAEALKGR
jgi:phosphate transport system substrate-binding protein